MNVVILSGNLTADPRTFTGNGYSGALYTLAVHGYGGKTDFIDCVCFGKVGDFAEQYLKKGSKIMIEGRISAGKYEKDGEIRHKVEVIVDRQEFCESRKKEPEPGDFFAGMSAKEIEEDFAPYSAL